MAVTLREVEHKDFNQIHQLFVEVYGKQADQGFKKAFYDHNQLLGFCLIDTSTETKAMVGFFGCFTFTRVIDGISHKFYNSHTWIVKKDFRKQSLRLLLPYIKLKDGIITNFSANGKVAQILEQLKFTKLVIVNHVIKSPIFINTFFKRQQLAYVESNDPILNWHQHYNCLCLSLKINELDDSLNLILKAVNKKPKWLQRINKLSKAVVKRPLITKRYFLYKVHYVSDTSVFMKHLSVIRRSLFQNHKVGGLIFPDNLISELPSQLIMKSYEDEVYVKSSENTLPQIDYLYSEVFYLNIKDK